MKIYFCDGCNESIPLVDIQAGQVTTIKGKLFCRNCIPPGAGGAGAASGAPTVVKRGTHPLVVLLLLALLGYVVWRDLPRLRGAAPGAGDASADVQAGADHRLVTTLQADLARLAAQKDELERKLTRQREDLDKALGTGPDLQRALDQARAEIDSLQRGQAETGQLIEKLHLQENRTAALEARINTLADMLASQQQALALGLTQKGPEAVQPVAGAPAVDASQQAEIEAIRHELLDADAGRRFEAVDRVQKGPFKQLAKDLLPVLKDEDPFVRIRAMQTLGDFGYVDAVAPLFDALEEPSQPPPVRKTAAETLARLTGYDLSLYNPTAGKAERDKAVKKWRDWVASHS